MTIYKEQDIEYILDRRLARQISVTVDDETDCPWSDDELRIPKGTVLGQDSSTKKCFVIKSSVLDDTAALGQKVIPVADTTPFTAGDVVTLYDVSAGTSEDVTIDTISDGVSITATTNLVAAYAATDYVFVKGTNGSDEAKFILDEAISLRDTLGNAQETAALVTVAALIIDGRIDKITAREKAQLLAEGAFKFVEVE